MEADKEKIILVADYGRSGQGWLSYMLCYLLNARFIEPYDLLKGRQYSSSADVLRLTKGNLPGRDKSNYELIVKTHEYPASDFNLTDKVLLLCRDPRDVAVSAYYRYRVMKQQEPARNFKDKISFLIHRLRLASYLLTAYRWQKYYQAWKNIKCQQIRYEDLSLKTKETLKAILAYLEVAAKDSLIDEAIAKFSFEKLTGRRKGEEDTKNPEFRKGIIGDYENHFSKLELKIFNLICAKEARKRGYLIQ